MHKILLILTALLVSGTGFAQGREVIPLNRDWRFALQPIGSGFEETTFDDSTWSSVTVPHTWNAFDGQDGGTYVRGDGWYRKTFPADPAWQGRRVFVQFDAVSRVAEVYVNGKRVGKHAGAYGRFRFDITDALISGQNLLAVRANNEVNNIIPLAGDFTMCGGIYRRVNLIIVAPLHIALLDYGSPGVYIKTEQIDDRQATVNVKTLLENTSAETTRAKVKVEVADAAGKVVASTENPVDVAGHGHSEQRVNIPSPQLWHGRENPYLYRVRITLHAGEHVLDRVEQSIGLRTVRIDPDKGFFLNGSRYDLHGVNYHQDRLDQGYAVSDEDRRQDFAFMEEMGCTTIRLCHYQHDDHAYELCDQQGILAWAELVFHFDVPKLEDAAACLANAKDQLRELIRQNYNRPSIFCWSIGDETTDEELDRAEPLLRELNALAKTEDPTRYTTYASHHRDEDPRNFLTDTVGFNPYYGWYYGKPEDLGTRLDNFHRRYPKTALSISEYGAGASIYQHEQNPPYRNKTQAKGPWHPEEWQNEIHEASWISLSKRPYLWGNYIWLMFDFASDRRNEGDHAGRNDKGLVTYDRLTRKDAFFWYKANWTTKPLVYITSRRDMVRFTSHTEVKVYSNCETVELFVNGISHGEKTSPERLFIWKDVTLAQGPNRISVDARRGSDRVTDACYWIATSGTPYRPPTDDAADEKK